LLLTNCCASLRALLAEAVRPSKAGRRYGRVDRMRRGAHQIRR
jgi:hypothetical protein